MSIQEQLVDEMKSLISSNPSNFIKMIDDFPINNQSNLEEYEDKLIDSLRTKILDINFNKFCRINGFTEPIIDGHLEIGEIILKAERGEEPYDDSNMYYQVDFSKIISKKDDDYSYKGKVIVLPNLIKGSDKNIYITEYYGNINNDMFIEDINFHENSWGSPDMIKYNCYGEYGCVCTKVLCFRKPKI